MSQGETLSLPVDRLNDGNPAAEAWSRYDFGGNSSTYHGPNHTFSEQEALKFTRNSPTPSGTYPGTRRSTMKLTRGLPNTDLEGNSVVHNAIIDITFSFPIGISETEMVKVRQVLVAAMDSDTIMDDLNGNLEV